jgi:hypothetical protein
MDEGNQGKLSLIHANLMAKVSHERNKEVLIPIDAAPLGYARYQSD